MKMFDVYPVNDINIVKAGGSYVWDDKGIEYLDMYGGHAVISIGHTHPYWVKRIEEQLEQIAFYSNSVKMPIQERLAEKLGTISGRQDYQLFLCNSGAEANENALKLASFYNGRKKIISFSKSFHGRTSLAVAVTDSPSIVAPVNQTEHAIFLPFNDESALQGYFDKQGSEVCAVIIEGIQGVGGINIANTSFLQLMSRLCHQNQAVLIADAVQCGYGRTGKFYSHDYAGIDADIYTMAKGMGNGFPVAGISIGPHIKAKHFMLGTTYGGNPLACAAALAVLEVMENENLMLNAVQMGTYLMHEIGKINELKNLRGKGLMIGFDVPPELKELKKNLLLRHHIFTGESKPNVIRLLPALSLTKADADKFLVALREEVAVLSNEYKVAVVA